MKRLTIKKAHKALRKNRIRSIISGSEDRPRLSVTVSLNHVSAQLIDDVNRTTIAHSTTIGLSKDLGSMTKKAEFVGSDLAKKALKKGIKKIVFDRNGKLYHGRVKALADSARAEGLEF